MTETARRVRNAWAGWRKLRWPERAIVAEAIVLLPLVAVAVRLFGLRIVCGTLARTVAPADLKARPTSGAAWHRVRAAALPLVGRGFSSAESSFGSEKSVSESDRLDSGDEVQAIRTAVEIAARHTPVRPTCLTRSVTLWWLLGRRGIESTVRIGVRAVDGLLEAHAWVERGGQVVNDRKDVGEEFAAFDGRPLALLWSRS